MMTAKVKQRDQPKVRVIKICKKSINKGWKNNKKNLNTTPKDSATNTIKNTTQENSKKFVRKRPCALITILLLDKKRCLKTHTRIKVEDKEVARNRSIRYIEQTKK